jgi:hypothetical protein
LADFFDRVVVFISCPFKGRAGRDGVGHGAMLLSFMALVHAHTHPRFLTCKLSNLLPAFATNGQACMRA